MILSYFVHQMIVNHDGRYIQGLSSPRSYPISLLKKGAILMVYRKFMGENATKPQFLFKNPPPSLPNFGRDFTCKLIYRASRDGW
jgi:hypothetical protein